MRIKAIGATPPLLLPALAALAMMLALACGGAAAVSSTQPSTPVPATAGSGDLTPILATTVLGLGTQRVAFLLTSPTALIKVPVQSKLPSKKDSRPKSKSALAIGISSVINSLAKKDYTLV